MKRFLACLFFVTLCLFAAVPASAMTTMTFDEGSAVKGPFALAQQSDTIYAIVLVANTGQQITIPSGANKVLFSVSGGSDFYMKFTTSAIAVPGSNIVNGAAPELNPLLRSCTGQTTISLVSGVNCVVTMSFYQ